MGVAQQRQPVKLFLPIKIRAPACPPAQSLDLMKFEFARHSLAALAQIFATTMF